MLSSFDTEIIHPESIETCNIIHISRVGADKQQQQEQQQQQVQQTTKPHDANCFVASIECHCLKFAKFNNENFLNGSLLCLEIF